MAFSPNPRQARRGFLLAGLAATLALAGCRTAPRSPSLPRPSPVVVAPVVPIDVQRNLVAVIVPTSGADGAVGQSIANAANLALL
ncbi:MAG: penicillin-binding protein activator, partial [Pseudomonadota bacterium]|nr:penicillin-binding protein activator [Pseudomonadota bacterium]